MVERFRVQKEEEYPGKATVIFYTNGSEPPDEDLFYMEAEINSPMVDLQPGETYAMDTEWYPTRAGKDVLGVTEGGVIREHLRISWASGSQKLTRAYGVFFAGKIVAKFLDKSGTAIAEKTLKSVSPQEPVKFAEKIGLPKGTKKVALYLVEARTHNRRLLDEVMVRPEGRGD